MTPQEPAMGVSDEAVRFACEAFSRMQGRSAAGRMFGTQVYAQFSEAMRAALVAALPHMQPAGEAVGEATPEEDAAIDEAAGLVKITMRFPKRLMDEIDAGAAGAGIIRAAMIRKLVDYALNGPTPAVEALAMAADAIAERISYYAELGEHASTNIEDWAYTDGSGDIARLRAALAHPEIAALLKEQTP